jgi:hypothetical protein
MKAARDGPMPPSHMPVVAILFTTGVGSRRPDEKSQLGSHAVQLRTKVSAKNCQIGRVPGTELRCAGG